MAIKMVKRPAEFMVNVLLSGNNDLQGFLEFVPSGETAEFSSLMELMTLMQAKITQYGFPQSTTTIRTWDEKTDQGK
ncbi:MAG: hypothetical protein PHD40_02205 [Syntrophomonadaceae bacterium]|nr:hypothetical protein [Syntrophomonadaceae bacterium]